MTGKTRLRQGTLAWFEMVGRLMAEAASGAGLAPDLQVSLVERYTDGVPFPGGLVQGIRFEIAAGAASFRVGAWPGEPADVTVEITAAAARALNMLHGADPDYRAARERFLGSGEMRVEGDLSRIADWLDAVHDPIVDRTS